MTASDRPIKILIAALGGEGGGVLTNWIVAAAESVGFPVQSTSIPGVAQRTGATTYYIEIVPRPWRELGGRRPVLALVPGIGDIDLMVASEFLEATRAVANGFVTPDRTLLIASTHRFYVMTEKTAMGDGRVDQGRLLRAVEEHSQDRILLDLDRIARASGAMINAVMLGAMAGCGRLPLSVEALEAAIRADGKAVEANLRGFRAGLDAVRERADPSPASSAVPAPNPVAELDAAVEALAPAEARDVLREGVRRLVAYQDAAYAKLYLDRLRAIAAAARPEDVARLLRETARHLAVRMSFEDVIRVAEAKIAPERFRRIARELGAKDGEPFAVVEFLKPGIEELAGLLPPAMARRILSFAQRRGWLGRVHWGMEVRTTSISGFLRFWALAKLHAWRPRSHRFHEEQQAIEAWLARIRDAAARSVDLAVEIAECARLIKGYGDTLKRGSANYRAIEQRIIVPALAGAMPVPVAIDALANARTAALLDPEGEGLARCLADIEARAALPVAAE